ncbi:hypothetical protein CMV_027608 [Castanea mollissima]|uniref:Uncharacterized protein n=1 Tax=Castanea mollissima TaxID=60419 RepID=A0A8J4QJC9_9ROSI|nr:hypothetical protein CMV_027608 [Castanea mollissima]
MGMAKKKTDSSLSFRKYGVPLYSTGWRRSKDRDRSSDNGEVSNSTQYDVVLAGGGGEGRSGIPNAVLISAFDSDANSLSDQPVFRLLTGSELPYRTAVHPNGDGVFCSSPNCCRYSFFKKSPNSPTNIWAHFRRDF